MKKTYKFLGIMAVLFLWGTGAVAAQESIKYALNESFEQGLPDGWTQENVSGDVDWMAETGGEYPAGAADGQGRMALRNTTEQTQGFVTRLVTPVMDLSQMYLPILIFSHAQDHNLGDVDELRVYYRASASSDWILFEEDGVFTDRARTWEADTIVLSGASKTYQIAFEGTDKFGRGVVLDKVQVRPMPTCTDPQLTLIDENTSSTFRLNWMASFDAQSCVVRVSESELEDPETALPSELFLDTVVVGASSCLVEGLEVNTTYYAYVKANCGGESSGWMETSYTTQATITLPHSEDFNLDYEPGVIHQSPASWIWGNSWPEEKYNFAPFVNSGTSYEQRDNYSADGTSVVCFASGNSTTGIIDPGEICWLISPELIIDTVQHSISDVEITFWGTSYKYVGKDYASSLIVGMMEDPQNIATIVPIDTVTINRSNSFKEFVVSLENYTGKGRYVVFASAFDKENIFYLDNVTFDYKPANPRIMDVSVSGITTNTATVQIDPRGSNWEVVVTNEENTPPDSIQTPVYRQTNLSGSTHELTNLPSGEALYVYVRSVGADGTYGTWSAVVPFRTFCDLDLPMFFGFEEDEGRVHCSFYNGNMTGANAYVPECTYPYSNGTAASPVRVDVNTSSYDIARTGKYGLVLYSSSDSINLFSYIAFPPVEDVTKLQISFWMGIPYANASRMEVGVMTDPTDPSTFTPVAQYQTTAVTGDGPFQKCVVAFTDYEGEGKFISIRERYQQVFIDDVTIEELPSCPEATDLVGTPLNIPTGDSVRLDWKGNGSDRFRILVDVFDMTDTLDTDTYKALIDTTVTGVETLVLGGLTSNTNYYTTIKSVCEGIETEWWAVSGFTTVCREKELLPYFENFDDFAAGDFKVSDSTTINCWFTTFLTYGGTWPSVSGYSAYSEPNHLYLNGYDNHNTAGEPGRSARRDYVALPLMEAPVNQLQVSFFTKPTLGASLIVGVLPNLADTTSFIPVDTITAQEKDANVWGEHVVRFSDYAGTLPDGHIMFRMGAYYEKTTSVYVDNVEVDYASDCLKPTNLSSKDRTANSVVLYWEKGDAESAWDVMVLNDEEVTPATATAEYIVYHQVVNGTPEAKVEGLEPNTPYWYYVRSLCSEDTTQWVQIPCEFRTDCETLTVEKMGVETFEDGETSFDCWITGITRTDPTSTTVPNPPSISNVSKFGSKMLYIYNALISNNAYAIMPEIDIDSISRLQVTFSLVSTSTVATNQNILIVGVVTDPYDVNTFIPVDTVYAVKDEMIENVVRFDSYKGDNTGRYGKRVMFLSSKGEDETNYVYVDNIMLDTIPSCIGPSEMWADSISHDAAVLAWDNFMLDGYNVKVSTAPLSRTELASDEPIESIVFEQFVPDTNQVLVTGLTPITTYYMYIQGVCEGNNAGDWSFERSFTSACPPSYALPYSEGFDDYGTGSSVMAPCWTTYYKGGTTYPNMNATYNNTLDGAASMYVYTASTSGYYCMAVSPTLDTEDISGLRLSFDALNAANNDNYRYKLVVGVTQYPDSLTLDAFVPIDTICIPEDFPDAQTKIWYSYQYDLDGLDTLANLAAYKHIVFVADRSLQRSSPTSTSGTSGGLYVDNLLVESIPTCEYPADIEVSKSTESSFTVSWTEQATAEKWQIQTGAKGFALGEGSIIDADTTAFVVMGLSPLSEYDVYVRSIGQNDTSRWAGPTRGRTLGAPVATFPYVCGFEEDAENANWSATNGEATNAWYVGKAISKDGDGSLYISNDGGETAEYTVSSTAPDNGSAWMSRTLKLEKGEYIVSFDWTCFGNSTSDFMRAGLLPGDVTFAPSTGSTQGKVTNLDGSVTTMSSSATPNEWIHLEGVDEDGDQVTRMNGVDTTGTEIDWRTNAVPVIITEDMAGYYNLVFYWRNSSTSSKHPNPSAVIDNVRIEKADCPVPVDLERTVLGDTTLTVAWKSLSESITAWNVKVLETEWGVDSVGVAPDSVVVGTYLVENALEYTISGLLPDTEYYIYVQGACGGNWARVDARTICTPVEVGYEWTFDEGGGYPTVSSETYLAPDCWVIGNEGTETNTTYLPYMITGPHSIPTNNYIYSMGAEKEYALKLYSTASYEGSYAIMPAFVGDADTLQVHFFARAAYSQNTMTTEGYKINTTYTGSTYAHSIIVGTVTDPYDIGTFQPLDTVEMNVLTTSMYANEDNDWLFNEFIVPLKGAEGQYVTFMSKFGKSNYAFIDNVTIEPEGVCSRPISLKASDVHANQATVSWEGSAESYIVSVATDEEMANVVAIDTVAVNSVTMDELEAGTTYYVTVQAVCGSSKSRASSVFSFATAHDLLYREAFTAFEHAPEGWERYDKRWYTVGTFTPDSLGAQQAITVTSSTAGWVHSDGEDDNNVPVVSPHHYITTQSSTTYNWFVSPAIELPELSGADNEGLWLTFEAMLTMNGSYAAIPETATNTDDRFLVVISEDAGATWKPENVTTWSNDSLKRYDYRFNDIPAEFTMYRVHLDEFAGKIIKVAFYLESTVSNERFDLHIDNVRVNRFVEETPLESACEGHDYEGHGFYITYDNLKEGTNEYDRTVYASSSNAADSIISLTLEVGKMATYTFEATTCEGEPYENFDFVIAAGTQGEFKRKLQCASGCDSVAVLKLNIIETIRIDVPDTICQGQTYTFGGQELRLSGMYTDTVQSLVTSCDSITTLILEVRDALRSEQTEVVCFGETYNFGELTLTESGTYVDTVKTVTGCDSIVTLNLTVRDEILPTQIYGYVCPGETYTDENFEGVPAQNAVHELKVDPCDSLLVLHLTVLDDDTVYTEYKISEDELPFSYHGKTYDVGETGVHVQTLEVTSQSGNCSAVLVATLTIGDNVGMGMTQGGSLAIVPTLINRGQSVRLSGAGATELEVAVFDMTGRLVFHDDSMAMPAELSAFEASGIYTVKAIDGNGQVMYGRVIVK